MFWMLFFLNQHFSQKFDLWMMDGRTRSLLKIRQRTEKCRLRRVILRCDEDGFKIKYLTKKKFDKIFVSHVMCPLRARILKKKKTEWIAIQSSIVPRAREWVKWASERTSEHSRARERSKHDEASKRVSGASERTNGRANGPVLQSVFLVVLALEGWKGG